jgi:hypothetical protein
MDLWYYPNPIIVHYVNHPQFYEVMKRWTKTVLNMTRTKIRNFLIRLRGFYIRLDESEQTNHKGNVDGIDNTNKSFNW